MLYHSTRDKSAAVTAAQAIARGLSGDGGLFVPESFPELPEDAVARLTGLSYPDRAVAIMKPFLEDFTEAELKTFADTAYGPSAFNHPDVAPVAPLDRNTSFLELWHGPTCAFKDMALQMLPHLLSASLDKTGERKDVCILVATSGDTGKAALEGFRDARRTKIMVFYPDEGVSEIQKLQMTTQEGGNVRVTAVAGNFDDAQAGVKAIFSDGALRASLAVKGYFLSSANSINWGRLLPQIVYYISAYCDLVKKGAIKSGERINFCVPTGNFGNILAGYYAKKMGLPVGRLICASNCNDVLTEFIETGVYNKNRAFRTTISPSMDILVSSNLERLLFDLGGKDDRLVSRYMKDLSGLGVYEVAPEIRAAIGRDFGSGWSSDGETKSTIRALFESSGYLIDTHTAVAFSVLRKYREKTKDAAHTVVVSTASPFKFCDSVLDALGTDASGGGLGLLGRLEEAAGVRAPAPLRTLEGKPVRFSERVERSEMTAAVEAFLT